tara:strand:- start:32 stop:316 length:285 start_codon:yes stop_codon:yes gene_type:complete
MQESTDVKHIDFHTMDDKRTMCSACKTSIDNLLVTPKEAKQECISSSEGKEEASIIDEGEDEDEEAVIVEEEDEEEEEEFTSTFIFIFEFDVET